MEKNLSGTALRDEGITRQIGYEQVSNPRAHSANAALWEKTFKMEEN